VDPTLQELMAEGAPDDEVAVLLRLSDPTAAPPNVRLIAEFDNIVTCRLQRRDIVAVRSSAPVLSMKAARLYSSTVITEEDYWADENDESANSITEDAIADSPEEQSVIGNDWSDDGEALPDRVRDSDLRRPEAADLPTGKGVVIAHIDWGVDIAHPDFRLPDGRTRLLALWDQRGAAFPDRPNRYGYGRIFNRDEINQALLSGDPYATLGYHPADFDTLRGTHGTHTLSIAAGNGRSGGPVGIAPDADLIFVDLSTYTAEGPTNLGDSVAYCEAVDFVLRTVAALPASSVSGKEPDISIENTLEFDPEAIQQRLRPVVINSSLGRHGGPHVGLSLVEQGMDAALRQPGRAFVYSAGNYYNRQAHASGTLRPGETHTLRMVVETGGNRSDGQTLSPSEVELWYPGTDRLAVTITAPNGTRFGPVLGDRQSPLQLQLPGENAPRTIGQIYHRLNDPNNGDNEAMLFLYKGAPTGIYEITLFGEDVADGRYHLWIERNTTGRRAQATFEARDSRTECTTGTICNGFRTIAVGAYDAHAWYQNGDVPETGRPLAPFSSSGLTRDGRQKPDLCAPGVQVLAARSCPRHWPGKAEGQPPPLLTRMSGTSMAAPHVTGTIALIFEAAARPLTIKETRRLLLLATDPAPPDVTESARLRIGSGFLNIEAAVAAARTFLHTSKQVGRAPVQAVQQAVYSLAADRVLPFKETLQPMNPSFETNEAEAIEAEDAGYYPEYYPDDEAGSDVEAVRDNRQQFRRDGLSARQRIDSPSLGFVLPLGGNSGITPALSFPVGGRQSPFSVAVPLGGTNPPPVSLPPTSPPPAPSTPGPYANPYADPRDPILSAVAPYGDPMVSNGGYMPYAPVVVDDPAATPLMDADEFVAAGSDKSARPMVERSEQDVSSHQSFGEQVGNVIYAREIDDREIDESDEAFGERLTSVADALAAAPDARSFRSSTYLTALLDAIGQAQALSPLGIASGGHRPSASELYNAFVHSDALLRPRHHFREHYARWFAPVALPGSRLNAADLHPGDIVVRVARGENWGQFSIVASPRLLSPLELGGSPFGGYAPGGYVPVIECMPVPQRRQDNFVRRLTDTHGRTLPDTLVLRVRRSFGEESGNEAENDSQISPGDGTRPRVLARGASGAAVQNVQATLNRYSLQEISAGRIPLDGCPLEEDGKFGPMTQRAVRDFQMRQFSDDASQWDSIVGLRTWEKLDAVDSNILPATNPPFVMPPPGVVMPEGFTLPGNSLFNPPATNPSGTDLVALRHSVSSLIAAYVPSDTGDGRFDEIAQDYRGKGTTCGYLCHWLLWRLGCADRNIVNRKAPNGYTYRVGQNISRIWNNGRLPFVRVLNTGRIAAGERPEKGDIVFIAMPGGAATSEHVFVFLEEFQRNGRIYWRGADAGQRNAAKQECARYSQRELLIQGKNAVVRSSNGTERTVFGWLPLRNLTFEMPPMPISAPLLEADEWEESVTHTADLADSFFAAIHTVAATLQTQPQFLLVVMNSESGIRASAHNPNGHASGLIQFMPATLRGLGWTQGHEAFRRLTATEQMPFVQRYYLPFVRQGLNSTARLYQTTFLPATLNRGSEPDTVIVDINNNDNAFAYAPNRGLDRRGDGRILVGDLTAFVERTKGSARWREALERLQASAPGPVPPDPVPPAPLPPMPPGTKHPLLRRGARGNAVREAQTKLNIVHNRNVSIGVPGLQGAPLAVDGIFGVQTYNATVSFQQQIFPADPREWDGIIGSKTWERLDAASSGVSPPITPPIAPPVPPPAPVVDRRLSREEVMRWFVGGTDSQGQPMGRVTSNNRVSYLIRGRSTFDAMIKAMRTASTSGHFIYLLGWWMSDDFPLAGGVTPPAGGVTPPARGVTPPARGVTMQQLFTDASKAGVTVRAMLWDQAPNGPSNLRQNTAEVNRINALPNGAAILDNRTLNIGSHHQKILIVNGSEGLYAFCGGVDINPDRIWTVTTGTFSSGGAGTPLHDVHCQIQGPAAFDLLQIFQQRWNDHPDHVDLDRRKGSLPMISPPAPLPNGREWVQIGRTFGNGNAHRGIDSENFGIRPRGYTFLRGRAGEQTVKRMILHAIRQARQFIYLEDQYLVSLEIRDALIRALPNIKHLTILIPDGSISDLRQGNFRRREFIAPLRAAGGGKVRVFHPHPPRGRFGYVHSKMWVFDDEYAIIGSANCNRRGYTHDSEVVAGICDEGNGEDLRFAHRLRIDLWALHLKMDPAKLTDGIASAAYWLRPVGTGRVEPHDENAGIDLVNTDTFWNNLIDPDGS